MLLREIARLLNAAVEGSDSIEIVRVAKIEEARDGDITFLANPKYARFVGETRASAVIVEKKFHPSETEPVRQGLALLRVDDPYTSFLKVLLMFNPPQDPLPPGIHLSAVIDPSATLAAGVRVGPCAVIGAGSSIGAGAMICGGVVIERGAVIGEKTLIYPNVTVREGCRIGRRVIIQAGTTIGSDGFGFAPTADGTFEKIPQLGIVVIEDDVEIGANCAVDRATMGETVIRKGAKLDNLIQVAHNVVIGENTVIAAQTGISGSTKIGKQCMIGGQVGFTGHIEIADGTKVGAQSGVHRSVTAPNTTILGYPAAPHREALRMMGGMTRLADTIEKVRELEKRVKELENRK